MKHQLALGALLVLAQINTAHACLWDNDTLKEEALKQKDVAEIAAGKILRHSDFFYEEKIAYTEPLIAAGDAPAERYDDLAVAYDRLGRFDDAIKVMEEKEKRFPGLYTTLANLGTFYAHKGEIDKGLEIIKKAVALNPKAHFGREKYQIKALEYSKALKDDPSLSKQKDLLGLSLTEDEPLRFGDYRKSDPAFEKAGLEKDVFVALAGIIRFGSGEKNPHIWMSLGMALAYKGDKNLALRAFRRAEVLGHPAASWAAEAVLQHVGPLSSKDWPTLSKELDAEFEKGQAAVKRAQEKEDALLKAGKKTKAFGY